MASHRGRARIVSLLAPALSLLLTVLVSSAHAQVAGANLDGVITDDTGAALPGVTLTIRNAASGATQSRAPTCRAAAPSTSAATRR
jgi:hypothetical protein